MSHKTYHGDSSRENNFWVYPRSKKLVDSRWDVHDPNDLCDNHSFLGKDAQGVQKYKCNGHQNTQHFAAASQYSAHQGNTTRGPQAHGDPSRDNNFWVYPRSKQLVDPRWDVHDPNDLCDNHSFLGKDAQGVQKYKCNGHQNTQQFGAGSQYSAYQGNRTEGPQAHGDPSRDNNFWVYPRSKQLADPRWDVYDPNDLCDNHSLLGTDAQGVRKYKCNGHQNTQQFGAGSQYSAHQGNRTGGPQAHGDPSRDNNFWVYPRTKQLADSRWDVYDPNDLCDNHSFLGTDAQGVHKYKCNGHQNTQHFVAGSQYSAHQGNRTGGQTEYHGDPSRENNFWVYPRNKKIVNSRWDAYDPYDLCNNHTYLSTDPQGAKKYKCNGH